MNKDMNEKMEGMYVLLVGEGGGVLRGEAEELVDASCCLIG